MNYKTKLLSLCFIVGAVAAPTSIMAHNHGNKAMDHSHRSEANIARDDSRLPYRTLEFFGVKPTSKVVEIMPGGGWYTEILAPMLKEQGQLVAAHHPKNSSSEYRQRSRNNFEKKLADNETVYGNVVMADFNLDAGVDEAAKEADVVLTFRGLHGLQNGNDLAAAFTQFNHMLKQGGSLGVVQHQAPEGYDPVYTARKGYLPKSHVVAVAKAAGFDLVAEAYFHNNPKDRIVQEDVAGGVWNLPPSLNTDTDKERYEAVGESNRMTLLFQKR